MAQSQRPLAVVTGASSGIGRALAQQFAEHDFSLIIAAENEELDDAARELRALSEVEAVRVDLATREGVEQLWGAIKKDGRPVSALALNAGVGLGNRFVDQELSDILRLVELNVVSTVHLARLVIGEMVQRNEGKVLVTSSIASMSPGPYQALYNAGKSFEQSFADELKDTGVTVTALMPGPTETEFFERAGITDTKLGSGDKADAGEVARVGFEALMAGEGKVVAGDLKTKAEALGMRVLPDAVKAMMHRKQTEPGSA